MTVSLIRIVMMGSSAMVRRPVWMEPVSLASIPVQRNPIFSVMRKLMGVKKVPHL
jgi:hypothetical protein